MSVSVKWYGAKAKSRAHAGAANGLQKAAEHLLEKAQAITPVAPTFGGKLRDSGFTAVDAGALRAAVSFQTGYSIQVHETMTDHHSVGQAKYLEQPFNSERGEVRDIIAREIKKKL